MSALSQARAPSRAPSQAPSAAPAPATTTGPAPQVGAAPELDTPILDAAGLDQTEGPEPYVESARTGGGPLTKERSVAILQAAFGHIKKMQAGRVEVLDQAAFQAAYERIYGNGPYAWDKFVVPRHGNLNGFAHKGVNYINQTTANTGTVPHEMLHNNTASDWRPFVRTQFDEGATDILKQHALKKAGLTSPNSYPKQIDAVEAFLASGVSKESLFTAYLKGGAATVVGKHVDDNCQGSWDEVRTAMEAKDFARAKRLMRRK